MIREGTDRNVVAYGTMGGQNDPAIPQGITSTGRVVSERLEAIRRSTQPERDSETYQRTTTRVTYVKRPSTSPMEVVSAKKSRTIKPKSVIEQWIEEFKTLVNDTVQELHKECNRTPKNSLFHLHLKVVNTINSLRRVLDEKEKGTDLKSHAISLGEYKNYIFSQFTSLYNSTISPALEMLREQVDAGRGWMYFDNLIQITKACQDFTHKGHYFEGRKYHKDLLRKIWKVYFKKELEYLEYLKNSPRDKPSSDIVLKNIYSLLSHKNEELPIIRNKLISRNRKNKIKDKARRYNDNKVSDSKINGNERKREALGKSKRDNHHKTIMVIRQRHDRLLRRHDTARQEEEGENFFLSGRIAFLEELRKISTENPRLVRDYCTPLLEELKQLIPLVVKEIRDEMEKYTCDDNKLKRKALSLIEHLKEEGFLDEKHHGLYLGCTQSQDMVNNPNVWNGEINFNQWNSRITFMYNLVDRDDFIGAANNLKKLLINIDEIERVDSNNFLKKRIKNLLGVLRGKLFGSIFEKYNEATSTKKSSKKTAIEMRKYKDEIIKLRSCTFVLLDENLPHWENIACLAWRDDIDSLHEASLFSEYDVDNLLHLKDVVPDPLQNEHIKKHFQTALTKIFLFMLQNSPNVLLTEKVMDLAEWVNDLDNKHNIDPKLYEASKKWQEWGKKYLRTADGKVTVSDTSAERMPLFAYPAPPDDISAPAVYQPFLQLRSPADQMPMAQPPAGIMPQPAFPSVSASAVYQPFLQPKLLADSDYMPMAQPPAGIRPHSAPPDMSTSITKQQFQQPVSFVRHAPMAQPPAEIRPQPTLPGTLSSTISQILQQVVSTVHHALYVQLPTEIRQQPTPPLQPLLDHHEASIAEQFPGPATASSLFPTYPHHAWVEVCQPQLQAALRQLGELQSRIPSGSGANYPSKSDTQ